MPLFKQVDVFTRTPFKGNPVAVYFDAEDFSEETRVAITTWSNLSEVTFFDKPTFKEADYRIRIYTPPGVELPFAGHPTIGSAHAAIESGVVDLDKILANGGKLIQESKAGLSELKVTRDNGKIRVAFQPLNPRIVPFGAENLKAAIEALTFNSDAHVIGEPVLYFVGPQWLIVQLQSAEEVLNLNPEVKNIRLKNGPDFGITTFALGENNTYVARTFDDQIPFGEDPVCGSGNAAIALYISQVLKKAGTFTGTQGQRLGRSGKVTLTLPEEYPKEPIWISGEAVTIIDGTAAV